VLVSHRDYLAVAGRDLVEAGDALDERSALGPGGPGAILCQRKHRNRLAPGGEHVDPLVAVLERQVNQGMPGNASPTGQIEPDRPVGVPRARRAFGAVRDAVLAAAPVAPVVREAVPRVIRGALLRARAGVFLVGFRLLPPPELREVQGVELFDEPLLHLAGPRVEPVGEVSGVHDYPPPGVRPRRRSGLCEES